MTLLEFRDLLLTVTPNVFHFEAVKSEEYVVYQQTGILSLRAGNGIAEQGMRVAVDFFTTNEKSEIPELLMKALSEHENIFVDDYVIDYESDTKYIHYAYTCEVT